MAVTGGWAVLLGAAAWAWRPRPDRILQLVARPTDRPRTTAPVVVTLAVVDRLGGVACALVGRPASDRRRAGLAVVAGLVAIPVHLLAGPAVAAVAWAVPGWRRGRQARRSADDVVRVLPEVVDLFVLCASAGLTVALAVPAVGRRAPEPIAAALLDVAAEVDVGRPLADALAGLVPTLGEPVRPLVAALAASERYGAPVLDRLGRLADEVRSDRRRRAEADARRVPVKLLFPLVCCILPAFALLTVVPLLAGSFRSLH